MRTIDEITAMWAERPRAMQAQPYARARHSPRTYAEPVHAAFHAAAASPIFLRELIAHLKGATALFEALAERKPEVEPDTGDAGKPRRMHLPR
jgi:hypothetical protein